MFSFFKKKPTPSATPETPEKHPDGVPADTAVPAPTEPLEALPVTSPVQPPAASSAMTWLRKPFGGRSSEAGGAQAPVPGAAGTEPAALPAPAPMHLK